MSALGLRERRLIFGALIAILAARLLTLGAYPLTDTTEARYGEIARKMADLGDWITPWFDRGVPFWGKPPLAFWLSAASIRVFGVSEFAVRIPSFVLGLCLIGLVFHLALRESGKDVALLSALVLAATGLFFVCSGAVVTDTALALTVTLGMVAFWRFAQAEPGKGRSWSYVLFASLGLGLLAKGPVAIVLTGAPIGAWLQVTGRWRDLLPSLPWITGTLLTAAVAVPWYLIAERHTPGFLDYFLVGENFMRFTDPTWRGDLYGTVHPHPRGFIWLLWLAAALPWSLIILGAILRRILLGRRAGGAVGFDMSGSWRLYLALFALVPGLFFTFAGSVLPTYLVPGLPALAILVAEWWVTRSNRHSAARLLWIALPLPAIFVALLPLFNAWIAPDRSQKALLSALPAGSEVIYFPKRPFSGQFYSQGRATQASDAESLAQRLRAAPRSYVITFAGTALPAVLREGYVPVSEAGRTRKSVLWAPRDRLHAAR